MPKVTKLGTGKYFKNNMSFLIALLFICIPFYVYSNYFSKNQETIKISQEVNKTIEKNLENNI